MKITVIDSQGGGVGRQLISALRQHIPQAEILAVGTNSSSAQAMLKGGADHAASGENAVIVACRDSDLIIGPLGIVIADAMYGEITPKMAVAVAQARAEKILIPFTNCGNYVVGIRDGRIALLVEEAVQKAEELCRKKQ